MSRQSKIRWRESDAEKLEKEIKRFNNKIYRTNHLHPELASIQPETIKKKDKEKIIEQLKQAPRNETKKKINELDRYLKKGAEKAITSKTGNTVTKYEKKEVGLKVAQINRERTKERKFAENLDVTSRGKSLGMKRKEMGSERLNELKPKKFDFDKIRGGKEWQKFKETVYKQTDINDKNFQYELYKKNYITAMKSAYGEHANDVIEIIEGLPAKTVVDTYYKEQEASISFHYEPQEMQLKLDILFDIWSGVEEEYNDTDSGF
jgi:hypothetical protein